MSDVARPTQRDRLHHLPKKRGRALPPLSKPSRDRFNFRKLRHRCAALYILGEGEQAVAEAWAGEGPYSFVTRHLEGSSQPFPELGEVGAWESRRMRQSVARPTI